jgi:DNA polymerase-3 subunit delta
MKILSREDLRNQLRRREFAPVYVLFGGETYLRDLAAKTIADLLLSDSALREFNEIEHSLNTIKVHHALADAEQFPMIDSHRVIKITDVVVSASVGKDNLREEDEEALMRYLKRPAATSVVIFVANELDKRRKISKLLLENSVAVEFLRLKDPELTRHARDEVRKLGADFEERALGRLVSLVGDDVRKLTIEIEKLAVAALPEKFITSELVESLVANSREISNFDLTDHMLSGDKSRSLQILKKILDDGAEPLMLLGLIASNFRRLFTAKEMMNEGVDRSEVARVMRLPYSKQGQFLETARRTDKKKFSWIIQRIAQTDLAIKTSKGGGGPKGSRLQIEILVCELANL